MPFYRFSSHRHGKQNNIEKFSFKLKAYLFLMDPGYVIAFRELEDSPETEDTDAACLDEEGDPKPALINQPGQLQWILVTLCTVSDSALLRREKTSTRLES